MTSIKATDGRGVSGESVAVADDPVLSALGEAQDRYQDFRAQWARLQADLQEAQDRLAHTEEDNRRLAQSVEKGQRLLEEERARARRQAERAQHLAQALKEIHRAFLTGNVFELILKACLTITGATRGLYVIGRAPDQFRVRAAIDIPSYPEGPPSEFIQALCRKVLHDNTSFVANRQSGFADFPAPARQEEEFQNCLAAPVVLLANLNGVVIVADKLNGDFDKEDVDTVLSVGDQASVAVRNRQLQHELENAYVAVIGILADVLEAKDPYTQGHCEMVARLAHLTAKRLNLMEYDESVACYAALLHDVGKVGVSDGILNKPGPLLPEEWDLMRAHVRVGHGLLARIPAMRDVASAVLHHHERYDGAGYPDGLKGEEIPIAARIVCVVDAYCAMLTRRSYKPAYTEERAREELRQGAGSQFDPQVLEAFLTALRHDSKQRATGVADDLGPFPGFTWPGDLQRLVQAHSPQEESRAG